MNLDLANEKILTRPSKVMLIIGIILIAANLRTPITSVGPLMGMIQSDLHLTNTMAGLVTTIPLLAFAGLSPFVSKLSRALGIEVLLFIALLTLVIGSFLRPFGGEVNLFVGTFLIGLAIAVGNVLLPSLIKKEFPFKLGLMTGVYSISMNLCSAIAAGLTVPIAMNNQFSWRGSMIFWAILGILAFIIWLPQLKYNQKSTVKIASHLATTSVWKSPLAWKISLYMGSQSAIYYISIAWLPNILADQGLSGTSSGLMLSLMQFAVMPVTFIIPIIAGRMKNQQLLVGISVSLFLIGILGIMFANGNLFILSIVIILYGIGSGMSFSLSMMFFNLRTTSATESADLSGMAQSIGYLFAASGPILFGTLHDFLGSWQPTLFVLIGISLLMLYCGLDAGRNKFLFSKGK
ncbi:CynX/NimT family MFS transporter [Listeria seeligeri]|uniref:CynX/NimT family MFS transporter n=1 Tax=Listeria seeligeri TaxID=1640 RepID=UPI0016299D99|nr:CynX/NimT family MFS transporter [Listeria seeligeri]MBC1539009.1 CynX/NimT family MFS transporter [Listeria seeligeri]MBC1554396.1 CynX/NimT family MFS transporter [Listeria seeligeri]MBC6123653.1 CynX/NimT family MFS transporter [Listeria seeligeri]